MENTDLTVDVSAPEDNVDEEEPANVIVVSDDSESEASDDGTENMLENIPPSPVVNLTNDLSAKSLHQHSPITQDIDFDIDEIIAEATRETSSFHGSRSKRDIKEVKSEKKIEEDISPATCRIAIKWLRLIMPGFKLPLDEEILEEKLRRLELKRKKRSAKPKKTTPILADLNQIDEQVKKFDVLLKKHKKRIGGTSNHKNMSELLLQVDLLRSRVDQHTAQYNVSDRISRLIREMKSLLVLLEQLYTVQLRMDKENNIYVNKGPWTAPGIQNKLVPVVGYLSPSSPVVAQSKRYRKSPMFYEKLKPAKQVTTHIYYEPNEKKKAKKRRERTFNTSNVSTIAMAKSPDMLT